jgi:hypothetical protein
MKIGFIKVLIASFFVFGRTSLQAQKYRSISVRTPDNIKIAAQEWGNPRGPELVFIHGLGHSTFRGTTESRQRSSFEGSSSSVRDVCWRGIDACWRGIKEERSV